jgi:hypothetical protein
LAIVALARACLARSQLLDLRFPTLAQTTCIEWLSNPRTTGFENIFLLRKQSFIDCVIRSAFLNLYGLFLHSVKAYQSLSREARIDDERRCIGDVNDAASGTANCLA